MLVQFEQNRMVQTTRNLEHFDIFLKPFLQSVDAILEDASVAERNVMLNC